MYVLETLAGFLSFKASPRDFHSVTERCGYLRGFFDAEGGIPKDQNAKFYIQLVQKNKNKLNGIKTLLESLGISAGKLHNPSRLVDPNYWRIYIHANSHYEFINLIGSWHPRKTKLFRKRMMIWSMPYSDIRGT